MNRPPVTGLVHSILVRLKNEAEARGRPFAELLELFAVESLTNPERYPLVSRILPGNALQRPVSRVTALAEKRKSRAMRSRF